MEVYKSAGKYSEYIVTLVVDYCAKTEMNVPAKNETYVHYRAASAIVKHIEHKFTKETPSQVPSTFDKNFIYEVDKTVKACAKTKHFPTKHYTIGIHFFKTKKQAFYFNIHKTAEKYKFTGAAGEWYQNGQLKVKLYYKNGLLHRLYEHWYINGNLQYKINFHSGVLHGTYNAWFENQKIHICDHYYLGNLHGLCLSWDTNGKINTRCRYNYGTPSMFLHGTL